MAKGDAGRAQNQIDFQGGLAQNNLNNTRNNLDPVRQFSQNNYMSSAGTNLGNYDEIMQNYRNIQNQAQQQGQEALGGYRSLSNLQGPVGSGYADFAQTGGFTPQGLQDIRARSIAPTRAIFQRGMDEVKRNQALSGSNTGTNAALAKMARESNAAISDANVNANAGIAQMVQQGRLAGLGGGLQTQLAGLRGLTDVDSSGIGAQLAAAGGMGNLYGTTPGLTNMFGNQVTNANQQMLGAQGLQNQLAQMMIQGQLGRAQVPGNFQQALGNVGGVLGLAGGVANLFNPVGSGGFGRR